MTVEFYEWTLIDGATATGAGSVVDLRGLNIRNLWINHTGSGTNTAQVKVGLTSATCTTVMGHIHSNGSTTVGQDITAALVRAPFISDSAPPFIKGEVTAFTNGSVTLKVYAEAYD